jgi:hypothetical protein
LHVTLVSTPDPRETTQSAARCVSLQNCASLCSLPERPFYEHPCIHCACDVYSLRRSKPAQWLLTRAHEYVNLHSFIYFSTGVPAPARSMAGEQELCVVEQALPAQSRTVQVSRDDAVESGNQSFIEATVKAGSLCGCAQLQSGRLLCWELDPSARCLTVREVQLSSYKD